MSKERPTDDPRNESDGDSHAQTKTPWKGKPDKGQQSPNDKPDLEKWAETDTH